MIKASGETAEVTMAIIKRRFLRSLGVDTIAGARSWPIAPPKGLETAINIVIVVLD